jgi:hypothetical protein
VPDFEAVAAVIEETFARAVQRCEFDQIVGEPDPEVNVYEVSLLAARMLGEAGFLA